MAIETDTLLIQLEARVRDFEKNFARATRTADRDLGKIENRAKKAASRIDAEFTRLSGSAVGIGRTIAAGLGAGLSLQAAQQLIDASTRISNSLKIAGLAGEDLEKVYQTLFASAQRNAAPLESLVELYGRVAMVQGELGVSTADLLSFTDNVSVALRVAGTDAQSASGALLQLAQAMGGGVVRAEEFNSILEGAQPIAQAAAVGLAEAGGSVSKLRALVIDGKVSSEAFFAAFQAGSVVLQDKVVSAETTVSSSFVRLQNVLIDAAGRFNETSNAGQRFASFLDQLGTSITNLVNSPAFDSALNDLGDAISNTFSKDVADIQRVIEAVEGLAGKFDTLGSSVTDAELELAEAEQAVANLATNTIGQFGQVDAAFQDLVQQILEGRGTAESTAEAIEALGQANPNFANLQASIGGVIGHFMALRDAAKAAYAAAAQTDAVGEGATWSEFNTAFKPTTPVKPVTLSNYPIAPVAPGSGGTGGSGGGGGSRAPEREAAGELVTELQRELELLGKSEIEKRIDAELRRAGASATDDQKASITSLVQEIETETAAMERLEQAQATAQGMAKDFLGGLLGDLRTGVSGAEALANAFGNLSDKLLDMALNTAIESLFANLMGGTGGGNFLASLFGFADGGEVQAFANGGHVRGPGTGRSDSIPAALSNGEYVVNAAATAKNRALLEAINSGQLGKFADGGLVGQASRSIGGLAPGSGVTIAPTISIKVEGGSRGEQADQELGANIAKQVEGSIRSMVAQELRAQSRPGNTLNTRSR